MANITNQEKLNFNNAVEMASLIIHNGMDGFFLNTEFGTIAIEVIKMRAIPPKHKRVISCEWSEAPVTDFVSHNRNTKVDYYASITVRCNLTGSVVAQDLNLTRILVAKAFAYLILIDIIPVKMRKRDLIGRRFNDYDVDFLVYTWNLNNSKCHIDIPFLAENIIITRHPSVMDSINRSKFSEVISLMESKYQYENNSMIKYASDNDLSVPMFTKHEFYLALVDKFLTTYNTRLVYTSTLPIMSQHFLADYFRSQLFWEKILKKYPKDGQVEIYYFIKSAIKTAIKLMKNDIGIDKFLADKDEDNGTKEENPAPESPKEKATDAEKIKDGMIKGKKEIKKNKEPKIKVGV